MGLTIDLTGKRAVVTGGSSGIGEAICFALANAGADVAVNYHNHPEAAEAIVSKLRSDGGQALSIQADVAEVKQVQAMFAQLDDAWGGIDILINNAGVDGKRALAWEADTEAWRKVVEINLLGSFYCSQEALRRMVPRRSGVVINTTSVHEEIAWSGYSAYTASKAGVGMMMKTLAQEAAPHNVRVLSIAPGAIKTPINESVWSDPQQMQDLLTKIPLNRIGQPEEVAQMVVVLASDVASYVTATTIFVDGGMTDYPSFARGG